MKTAGHAVMASGITVAIGLLALLILPVPALRCMDIAGMLIPLASWPRSSLCCQHCCRAWDLASTSPEFARKPLPHAAG